MLGTESFSGRQVDILGGLPKQKDAFNCGVGIVAAIAIIIQNVCVEKPGQVLFNKQFVLQRRSCYGRGNCGTKSEQWQRQ
jgi:hypothetical protein